jgi:hypothetical protein
MGLENMRIRHYRVLSTFPYGGLEMSALDKLKLAENTRRTANSTPEGQLRNRMVEAINQQIAAAEAMQKGVGADNYLGRFTVNYDVR